ncbi:MAG: hypothetical protein ACE5IY_16205 [bacterium]
MKIDIPRTPILLVVGCLAFLMVVPGADLYGQGGRAGAFLRVGVGARAKALGDAYSAIATGVEAAYYNPAGLPFIENKQVMASYRFLSLDRQFSYIGFGMPVQPKARKGQKAINGGFSLAWLRAGVEDIDGRNTDGEHFDDLSNSENAFVFAFALNPAPMLSFGLTFKVLWNRFPSLGSEGETISASGVGFDFGAMLFPVDWLTLGVVVKEINSKYRWNTEDLFGEDGSETVDDFPKIIRYGVALTPPRFGKVILALDYEQIYKEKIFASKLDDRLHIGAEAAFWHDFVVRAGFDDGSVTAGGGYAFSLIGKKSQLNYAFISPGNRPEEEHIFSWVFQF